MSDLTPPQQSNEDSNSSLPIPDQIAIDTLVEQITTMFGPEASFEYKNSKEVHDARLEESRRCRQIVWENANRALHKYTKEMELAALEERVKAEEAVTELEQKEAAARERLRDLEQKKLEAQKAKQAAEEGILKIQKATAEAEANAAKQAAAQAAAPQKPTAQPAPVTQTTKQATPTPITSTPQAAQVSNAITAPVNPFVKDIGPIPPAPNNPFRKAANPAPTPQAQPVAATNNGIGKQVPAQQNGTASYTPSPEVEKYRKVHQECKKLRKFVLTRQGDEVKKNAGAVRRIIRMTVGQLSSVPGTAGGNKQKFEKIITALKSTITMESALVDPSSLFINPPQPKEGANNDPIPSMFLYCLNMLVKIIVGQAVAEVPSSRGIAQPLALLAHWVFSDPSLRWRDTSFVDILIAKFSVSCPALFGARGNENTAIGRANLGWKEGVPEQAHMSATTGVACTYAALSTRTYTAKSQRQNPYPPFHYWAAIAGVLNTPAKELSKTQLYMLEALIQGYQAKFVEYYGDLARQALVVALYHLPNNVNRPELANAIGALKVLADATCKVLAEL